MLLLICCRPMRFLSVSKNHKFIVLLLIGVMGQSLAQFEITKYSINSGAGVSESGNFKISGSVGQVDANVKSISGDFSISGGFWHETQRVDDMFMDGFE